jgi:hypothetical protein
MESLVHPLNLLDKDACDDSELTLYPSKTDAEITAYKG